MWLEVAVAAVLVVVSLRYFWIFAKHGYDDPYGDAKIAPMGGVLLVVVGTAFAAGAAGLRWKGAKAWVIHARRWNIQMARGPCTPSFRWPVGNAGTCQPR